MNKKSGIYKITINNKLYVGCTINLEKRKKKHYQMLTNRKHENDYLQKAFNKHNEFKFDVLEECVEDALPEREIYWIGELNTLEGDGYNLTAGGVGMLRWFPSDETRKKISEAAKGRTPSEETRKKMSESGKGRIFSEEHKRKIGEASKGKTRSEETRKKISEAHIGMKASEETRKKMSKTRTGMKASEEAKKNISIAKQNLNKYTIEEIKEICLQKGKVRMAALVLGVSRQTIWRFFKINDIKIIYDDLKYSNQSKIIGFEDLTRQ